MYTFQNQLWKSCVEYPNQNKKPTQNQKNSVQLDQLSPQLQTAANLFVGSFLKNWTVYIVTQFFQNLNKNGQVCVCEYTSVHNFRVTRLDDGSVYRILTTVWCQGDEIFDQKNIFDGSKSVKAKQQILYKMVTTQKEKLEYQGILSFKLSGDGCVYLTVQTEDEDQADFWVRAFVDDSKQFQHYYAFDISQNIVEEEDAMDWDRFFYKQKKK